MQTLSSAAFLGALVAAQGKSANRARQDFLQWSASVGRSYATYSEMSMREAVFSNNDDLIKGKNSAAKGAKFAHNKFSDLTSSEFQSLYLGGFSREDKDEEEGGEGLRELQSLPAAVNWFTAGKVNDVKDQGACGSCWAFGSMTALEGMIAIRDSAAPVRLSEQEVVSCSYRKVSRRAGVVGKFYSYGCSGGWADDAVDYVKYNGVASNASYPYTQKTGTCVQNTKTKVGFTSGYTVEPRANVKAAVVAGPLSIDVQASDWQFYSSGVF